jgi:hypothetical protein
MPSTSRPNSGFRRTRDIRRPFVAPLSIVAAILASATVAAFVDQPAWAAVAGAGLVLIYWIIDALIWRRARQRKDLALGLAMRGMVLRLAAPVFGLLVIALLDRPATATAALSFLAAFTVYNLVRSTTYPQATPPAGQARLQ